MDLKKEILKALGLAVVKFETQAKLMDGTIIVSTADELAVGVDISILAEDGTTMALPVGEYELEDGTIIVVEEDGIIAAITPPAQEEAPAEALSKEEFMTALELVANEIETLKAEIKALKDGKEELTKEVKKFAKQPATAPLQQSKFTQELNSVEFSKLTPQQKYLYNLNK